MHRTHAGHGSIWPAETSDGMFASTMPTTADLAAANYARKTAERERDEALALATRAREDALREAVETCKEADAQDDRDNGAAATGAACNAANAILAPIEDGEDA